MSVPEQTSTYHAWYSAKQEQGRRSNPGGTATPSCLWYSDTEGKSVEVTMVTTTPEHGCDFDDLEYRGVVVHYVGVCRD